MLLYQERNVALLHKIEPPSADVSAASIASKDRRYGALGEGDADLDSSAEPPSSDADS